MWLVFTCIAVQLLQVVESEATFSVFILLQQQCYGSSLPAFHCYTGLLLSFPYLLV